MSVNAGKREVRRATALRSMPHSAAALAAGARSPEHVDLLAGANSGHRQVYFESHEEQVVDHAKVLRFADCYRMIEYWKQRADAEAARTTPTPATSHVTLRRRRPWMGWSTCALCSTPSVAPRSCRSWNA